MDYIVRQHQIVKHHYRKQMVQHSQIADIMIYTVTIIQLEEMVVIYGMIIQQDTQEMQIKKQLKQKQIQQVEIEVYGIVITRTSRRLLALGSLVGAFSSIAVELVSSASIVAAVMPTTATLLVLFQHSKNNLFNTKYIRKLVNILKITSFY